MKHPTILVVVFLLVTAGVSGVAVADDTPTPTEGDEANDTPDEDMETSDDEESPTDDSSSENEADDVNDADIDTSRIEEQVSHVKVHKVSWSENSIEITVSGARSDTIQVTEFSDGDFSWETYDIGPEPITINHSLEFSGITEVGFSVISAQKGTILESPTASPLSFSRGAQWSDHWVSGGTAVGMVFVAVLYRYKRRQFFAETELRSLLSGRKYRKNASEEGWTIRVLRHVYSPRSILVGIILILIAELLTGAVWSRLSGMATETQLASLVAIIGLPAYWYVAGRILRLVPISDQPKMVTLDNREQGGIDVLTGAREWFDDMAIRGADQLQKKPITGTQDRAYLAHHYDAASHAAVATWHEVLDVVEVARNYTAAYVNYDMLSKEIDEAREIKSAQPALRQKYQREGQKVAMRKMDDTHFDDDEQASTNDLMADVMDNIEHDDEPNTVDTESLTNDEDSDSDDSEGDANE